MNPAYLQQYRSEAARKIRSMGAVVVFIVLLCCTVFYWTDRHILDLFHTFGWRLLAVSTSLLFLIFGLSPQHEDRTRFLYTVAFISYLVMMAGIAFPIFSNPLSTTEQKFGVTIGCMTAWIFLPLLSFSQGRPILIGGIIILVVSLAASILSGSAQGENVGYLSTIGVTSALSLVALYFKGEYDLERAMTLYELKESREILRQQASELQLANDNLVTFTRALSHDLRGPIRRAQSFLQLFERKNDLSLSDEQTERLQLAQDNLKQCQQIFEDLLIYAEIGKEELSKEEVDVEKICRQVLTEQIQATPEKSLSIRYHIQRSIHGDRHLIWHILTNLIENALKYSASRPHPSIRIGTKEEQQFTILFVEDNGIGFDSEQAPDLGQPFKRLHGDAFSGTGIGLTIVRQIMKLHNGRFWAKSQEGQGATFFCAFPNN